MKNHATTCWSDELNVERSMGHSVDPHNIGHQESTKRRTVESYHKDVHGHGAKARRRFHHKDPHKGYCDRSPCSRADAQLCRSIDKTS